VFGKPGGEAFYQDGRHEAFYSALAREVDGVNMKSAAPDGWKGQIKNWISTGKVKADEVEWSGLNDWLDLQQGKVSKEQVSEFLRDNGVRVETVHRDGDGQEDPSDVARELFEDAWPNEFTDWLEEANSAEIDKAWDDPEHPAWKIADEDSRKDYEERHTDEEGDVDHDYARGDFEDDVARYIRMNGPEDLYPPEEWEEIKREAFIYHQEDYEELARSYIKDQEAASELEGTGLPTKHGEWKVPGGENYREVLLMLRETEKQRAELARREKEYKNSRATIVDRVRAADDALHALLVEHAHRRMEAGDTLSDVDKNQGSWTILEQKKYIIFL
jgi:hypothetical protein